MTRERLVIAGTIAGVAILAAVVGLIFQFGRSNPSPPSLQDHPNAAIPGEVIYVDPDSCITRIDASGTNKHEIACVRELATVVRLDERTIAYGVFGPSGLRGIQRDLVTGAEQAYPGSITPDKLGSSPNSQSLLGEIITTDNQGSVYRSGGADGQRVRIYKCDCPEHRTPQFVLWSPDGQWALLGYGDGGHQELWVLARDGSFAGTLAEAGYNPGVSWYMAGKGVSPKPN